MSRTPRSSFVKPFLRRRSVRREARPSPRVRMPMMLRGESGGNAVARRDASLSITRLMSPSSYCVRIENQRVSETCLDCKDVRMKYGMQRGDAEAAEEDGERAAGRLRKAREDKKGARQNWDFDS